LTGNIDRTLAETSTDNTQSRNSKPEHEIKHLNFPKIPRSFADSE